MIGIKRKRPVTNKGFQDFLKSEIMPGTRNKTNSAALNFEAMQKMIRPAKTQLAKAGNAGNCLVLNSIATMYIKTEVHKTSTVAEFR